MIYNKEVKEIMVLFFVEMILRLNSKSIPSEIHRVLIGEKTF